MNRKFFTSLAFSFFIFHSSFAQQIVTVEEVVQMAIQKNYDIRVAQTTAATQFTDKRFIYGAFIPTLNAGGTFAKNYNSIINQAFPVNYTTQLPQDGAAHNFNGLSYTTNSSIQAAWTVFDGTKMFATRNRLLKLAEWGETNHRGCHDDQFL